VTFEFYDLTLLPGYGGGHRLQGYGGYIGYGGMGMGGYGMGGMGMGMGMEVPLTGGLAGGLLLGDALGEYVLWPKIAILQIDTEGGGFGGGGCW
jgi:hypothetical protein